MGQSREQAGFTQPEMAELFSVHFRTVQDWESPRKKAVPFDRLGEWAELTQVKREWLLHGDEASSEDELAVRLERQLRSLDERLARMEQLLRDSPPQGHRRGRQR
jgi:transcriptional regulator with XRE-family HTH domain